MRPGGLSFLSSKPPSSTLLLDLYSGGRGLSLTTQKKYIFKCLGWMQLWINKKESWATSRIFMFIKVKVSNPLHMSIRMTSSGLIGIMFLGMWDCPWRAHWMSLERLQSSQIRLCLMMAKYGRRSVPWRWLEALVSFGNASPMPSDLKALLS